MDEIRDPQYKTKDGSALRIWQDPAKNPWLTEKEGRPIFDDVTYVEVISPGSRDSTPVFEVRRIFAAEAGRTEPHYGVKWPEYKEFIEDFDKKEANDATLSGTPLSEWSEMSRTMGASLRAQSIFTVDALANLPDTKLNIVGPDGRTWREKAKAYISNASNGAFATQLAAELERTKADNTDLQAQVAQLASTVAALQAAQGGATPALTPPTADPFAAVEHEPLI